MRHGILSTTPNDLGFVTSKEVDVAPWFKKPDVEFFDASGELLTIYLDVTLPALHQEAITSREEIYENARQLKAKAYPRKDSEGRLLNESFCLPFILTSMGGLCKEGHEFLHLCKKRNKAATLHLLDVLVTQHAKWTAKRVRRGLFGQSIVDFSTASWSAIQLSNSAKTSKQAEKTPRLLRSQERQLLGKTPRLLRTFADKSAQLTDVPEQAQHQSFIPGMSAYDSQDASIEAGTAQCTSNFSLSTKAAHCEEYAIFSQTSDVESDAGSLFG